jgi:aspartate/methionine/tyrosine aminotransferase
MSALNPQAVALNDEIERGNSNILNMLSERGKGIFFPKKGILAQGADAAGKDINATIGLALEDDGSPLHLDCIQLDPGVIFPYAPSFGRPDLRKTWRQMIYQKNPTLEGTEISNPVVTSALTHGLSMCGYLFADDDDELIIPDLYWGNYNLVFKNAYGVRFGTYETFDGAGFNIDGLRAKLLEGPVGKRLVSLNFPNNPTGYTPTPSEIGKLRDVLIEAAEAGNVLVAIIDDAYFGLVYEEDIAKESIFPTLANAHERILAIKIDGATKEDYVWGFRVGFITYAIKGGTDSIYSALEAKTAGAIRGNVSNSPNLSQSILNQAFASPEYEQQKKEKFNTLKRRYDKVKVILSSHPEYRKVFVPLPFNSGYFMCLKTISADPEKVRQLLLNEFSTGIIVANGVMRVAFSSTPYDLLETLFDNIYQATKKAENV